MAPRAVSVAKPPVRVAFAQRARVPPGRCIDPFFPAPEGFDPGDVEDVEGADLWDKVAPRTHTHTHTHARARRSGPTVRPGVGQGRALSLAALLAAFSLQLC